MAVECDVLLLGPSDPTGRLLRALLMSSGLGVSHPSSEREAVDAGRSPLLRVVVTYAPPSFDDAWVREVLDSPALARLPIVSVRETAPEALDALVAEVSVHCAPLSP